MSGRKRCLLALVGLLLVCATALAVDGPLQQVRTTVDAVLATLQDKGLAPAARREKLSTLIRPRFDFPVMSQWVLGTNWRKATPEQRTKFVAIFSDILEETYVGKIENYTDEKVEFQTERRKDGKAEVDTVIKTASADIPLRYKLYLKGSEWLVYDVVIEEVSLIRNFRSTYDEIARKEGMDGLLAKMADKLKELRDGNARGKAS